MQFHHFVKIFLRFTSWTSIIKVVHSWTASTPICTRKPIELQWSTKRSYGLLPKYTSRKINHIIYSSLHSQQQHGCINVDTNNSTNLSDRMVLPSKLYNITLRNATLDDLSLLLFWDEKDHLQNSSGIDIELNDWNWEYELPRKDLSWRYQLIAEDSCNNKKENIPIGFVQIIDPLEEESHYWGIDCEPNLRAIDIWIGNEEYINKGYGTQIMKQILQCSFVFGNPNVTGVIIDPMASNVNAHRFYQRLGFKPIGIRYFGQDECLIHRMNRTEYVKHHCSNEVDGGK